MQTKPFPSPRSPTVAVIGLGSMGFGIASSLLRNGFDTVGCDIDGEALERFAARGGRTVATAAEAARGAGVVVSAVVNAAQTLDVLGGADGVLDALAEGTAFVCVTTMDPAAARSMAEMVERRGGLYLDAPISGGTRRAAEGALTVLASGSRAAFDAARAVLDATAAKVYELGDQPGQGSAFKMINQHLAGVHIAAACEAIAFAARQQLDLRKVYEVITGSAGNSWMFENRVPHILERDPVAHSAVDIFVKDLGIVTDMARNHTFPVPLAAAALQMFVATSGAGMGRMDDSSVASFYAKMTNTELVPESTAAFNKPDPVDGVVSGVR